MVGMLGVVKLQAIKKAGMNLLKGHPEFVPVLVNTGIQADFSERPAIVDNKERFGDMEIDTVIVKNHIGALLAINDRADRFYPYQKA